ncbi:MAG: Holliday junction resolvase RuvX [Roseiflexaceae bacterium]
MVHAELGRVMALDVGGKRIGVALSDPTRILASPLITIHALPRQRALHQIASLINLHEAVELVVGMPLTMAGEHGEQAKLISAFVEDLRGVVIVPIHTFDERLTSVAAERMMIDLGMRPEQRKAKIDEVAASIILQDFLDSRRTVPPPRNWDAEDDDDR